MHAARWTSAVEAYNDNLSLVTDNEYNLVALRYNGDAEQDSDKAELDRIGQMNIGDFVNRIKEGTLVMQLPDAEFAACKMFILASVLGMISLVVMLPKSRYTQLLALQKALQSHVKVRQMPPTDAAEAAGPVLTLCWQQLPDQYLQIWRELVDCGLSLTRTCPPVAASLAHYRVIKLCPCRRTSPARPHRRSRSLPHSWSFAGG